MYNNHLRSRQNQGYVPTNATTDIWTTTGTYPPPTYEHIDESSQPINPPPSYNAALLLNYQSKENNNKLSSPNMMTMISSNTSDNLNKEANDGVVLYRPNTQTNDTTTTTTNINPENSTQINDGEILIMFKQPNQKDENVDQDDSVGTTNLSSNDKSLQHTQNS